MSTPFLRPRPSRSLMWLLGHINRWFLLFGVPVLRRIPVIRDLPGVRGWFWLRSMDLPPADLERLRRSINPETAAFVAPNHPEFGFDWMVDKEISTLVAPRMASWASHDVVAGAPGFWLRNNLISNAGGLAAQSFSVDCALRGDGVLLHPEGSVRWTGAYIHPLFTGVAEMACSAARQSNGSKPVYIVPVVWAVEYVADISRALHGEMRYIEQQLRLARNDAFEVHPRFDALQENILERQMRSMGFDPAWVAGLDFFARQDAFRDWLIEDLDARYTVPPIDSVHRHLARLRMAIPRDCKSDRARVEEANRLCGFSRDAYPVARLTPEQIGECLKRHRATLLRRGIRNAIHNVLPRPYGPRVLHVRVPEPIRVDPTRAREDFDTYARELLSTLRERMQVSLDELGKAKTLHFASSRPDTGMLNHGCTRDLERQHRLRNDQRPGEAVLGRPGPGDSLQAPGPKEPQASQAAYGESRYRRSG